MYSLILLATIGAGIGLFLAIRSEDKMLGTMIFGTIFGTIIGSILGLFTGWFIAYSTPRLEVIYGPVKLVSMRSAEGISGTFIWGTGSINNSISYNFITMADDESMVPNSVIATTQVHFTEDASLKNTGTWTTIMLVPDKNSYLYKWGIGHNGCTQILRHDFRVPVGTVLQQFNVK